MLKYGIKEIKRRVIEIKFVNHIVDFSFKIGTSLICLYCPFHDFTNGVDLFKSPSEKKT